MADRTIEDVLQDGGRKLLAHKQTAKLHAATAERPVFSADGSLAVIRTDPELAELLLELTKGTPRMDGSVEMFVRKDPDKPGQVGMVMPQRFVAALHRAALLAAPSPADPEEDGDEG